MASYGYYPIDQRVGSVSNVSSGLGRQRHFYTEPQLALLEAEFAAEPFPNKDARRRIALRLGVADKSVLWWYQNRRRRVRQQYKSVEGNPSAIRTRRHRRTSPYTSQQSGHHQQVGSIGNEWIASDSSSWSAWPYPVTEANELYSTVQPHHSLTDYQQELSPTVSGQVNWISTDGNADQFSHVPDLMAYYNYPPEFQHQQTYSGNNYWDYSPPFYPGTMPISNPTTEDSTTNHSIPNSYCYSIDSLECVNYQVTGNYV